MFCSPFRRRRKARAEEPGGVAEESYLSREEAWSLYWAKLEEEANYFSVGDHGEAEPDICTCHTCIVSSITRLGGLMSGAGCSTLTLLRIDPSSLPTTIIVVNTFLATWTGLGIASPFHKYLMFYSLFHPFCHSVHSPAQSLKCIVPSFYIKTRLIVLSLDS